MVDMNDIEGKICPYCRYPIRKGDESCVCSICLTPHHWNCWKDNGRCSTFDCNGVPIKGDNTQSGHHTHAQYTQNTYIYCIACGKPNSVEARFCSQCGNRLSKPSFEHEHRRPAGYYAEAYAGFWRRFWAFLLDYIILVFGLSLIISVFSSGYYNEDSIYGPALVISWLYYALMESSNKKATLGKMALGIVVTDLNGNKISFGRATARYLCKFLSGLIFAIGYIMAVFTDKKQALHDMIAGCVVVKKQR